jgi:diguanylate cyclase (GGDEF)-like protein
MHLGDTRRQSRAALVAVVLFLVFDSIALGLNFWLTWRIESQAIGINLAGRQRMLSQRMVKVLLQMEASLERGNDPAPQIKELALTFQLFDDTLNGFAQGHVTRGGADEELFLAPVHGVQARLVVDQALAIWAPYRSLVRQVLDAAPATLSERLPVTVDYAREHNLTLLKLMNQLTTELEIQTKKEASQIRYYQAAAFALALLNFFGAFVLYQRRIREAGKHHDLLDEIINKVSASVMVVDAQSMILKANHTAEALFGYPAGGLNGRSLAELLSGREDNRIGHRKDGTTFLALTECNEATLDDRTLYIETVIDVTRQRMTEEHLSSLAYHDLLTRLPNRLLFDDRLRVELARAQRRNQKLCVMFIDLDNFKPVNDRFGHDIGDALLKEVAVRLQGCLRESDTVARRGGDEFTVVVSDIGDDQAGAKVAQVIVESLREPFVIAGRTLLIGGSIGISIYPDDAQEAGELIARADEAMYRAKAKGRGSFCFYREIRG